MLYRYNIISDILYRI